MTSPSPRGKFSVTRKPHHPESAVKNGILTSRIPVHESLQALTSLSLVSTFKNHRLRSCLHYQYGNSRTKSKTWLMEDSGSPTQRHRSVRSATFRVTRKPLILTSRIAEVLGISRNASKAEVKKAYHKVSHPQALAPRSQSSHRPRPRYQAIQTKSVKANEPMPKSSSSPSARPTRSCRTMTKENSTMPRGCRRSKLAVAVAWMARSTWRIYLPRCSVWEVEWAV